MEDVINAMTGTAANSGDLGGLIAGVSGIVGGALFAVFGGNVRNLLGDTVYNIVVFSIFVWSMLSTAWLIDLLGGFTIWGVSGSDFPYALIIIAFLYEFRAVLF